MPVERRRHDSQDSLMRRRCDDVPEPVREELQPLTIEPQGIRLPLVRWPLVWKALVVAGSIIAGVWTGAMWWAAHTADDVERDKRIAALERKLKHHDDEIGVVQMIDYSEHPAWWRDILASQKE